MKGKILLAIVNEPPSEDEHFFQGKALTYYGRWSYKFEEAARRGAAGVLVIHRTDLASYGWDVVRNSEATEASYLRNDPLSVLRAASWIQLDVARKLFAAVGMNADQMIEAAGKRGFKAVELPVRLKAHIVSQVRKYDSANVIGMVAGADSSPATTSSIPPITITWASISLLPATRSSMARWTMRPVVASCWKWCGHTLRRKFLRPAMCILPRLPRKSRGCWGQSTWVCILRSPFATSR